MEEKRVEKFDFAKCADWEIEGICRSGLEKHYKELYEAYKNALWKADYFKEMCETLEEENRFLNPHGGMTS